MAGSTYVALLRGVNVGGRNKVPMGALKDLCGTLGFADVVTYIQSGNVVFDAERGEPAALADAIAAGISHTFGLDVAVVVRTAAEVHAVATGNPFETAGVDPTLLHVLFLASTPGPAAVEALAATSYPPNEYVVRGQEVYLRTPDGLGRTKLPNFDRVLGTPATQRNWRTVLTLADMARR